MTSDEALMHLSSLGNSIEEVAQALIAQEIRGFPRDPNACPIAHFLEKKGALSVSIGTTDACVGKEEDAFDLPQVVTAFIRNFDNETLDFESMRKLRYD